MALSPPRKRLTAVVSLCESESRWVGTVPYSGCDWGEYALTAWARPGTGDPLHRGLIHNITDVIETVRSMGIPVRLPWVLERICVEDCLTYLLAY